MWSRTPPDPRTLRLPPPTTTALRQAPPSPPCISHTSILSRPLYYFGISSKQRGVHQLSLFLPPQHLVQFSTLCAFMRSAPLGAHPFSPLCGIWKHGVGKTNRSSIGRRRTSCTLLRKHTLCWIARCGANHFCSLHIAKSLLGARNTHSSL